MKNIIVCIKQVVDPEEPPSSFTVDESSSSIVLPPGVPYVISPFDRYAVEAALRIKDQTGAKVTALSVGPSLDRTVVRDPIAMGADDLILVEDDRLSGADAWLTALVIAGAIGKIGAFDLIMCGRQASDTDGGLVGTGIAEILGLPCITIAQKVDIQSDTALVERVIDEGYEIVEALLPAIVTVSNELGEPRYPTIKQVMASKKTEPVVWSMDDLDIEDTQKSPLANRVQLRQLVQPSTESHCELVMGQDSEEAGIQLALRLHEAKII